VRRKKFFYLQRHYAFLRCTNIFVYLPKFNSAKIVVYLFRDRLCPKFMLSTPCRCCFCTSTTSARRKLYIPRTYYLCITCTNKKNLVVLGNVVCFSNLATFQVVIKLLPMKSLINVTNYLVIRLLIKYKVSWPESLSPRTLITRRIKITKTLHRLTVQ